MDADVGSIKKIIPTLNGSPVTCSFPKTKKPTRGRNNSLIIDPMVEMPKLPRNPFMVSAPPMEMRASGRAAADIRRNVLSIKAGKNPIILE